MEERSSASGRVKPLSLLYHDVVPNSHWDDSGFPGAAAAPYKFSSVNFTTHIAALDAAIPARRREVLRGGDTCEFSNPVVLTFDDGGVSGYDPIADILEQRGWRGHFFITTDYMDRDAFLSPAQIRELRNRGHAIGSHSCSHPPRISRLPMHRIEEEWKQSSDSLSQLLGEQVKTASVPGGYYSHKVARAAASAGIEVLFTSEPTTAISLIDGCLILGRFTLWRGMSAHRAVDIAVDRLGARAQQSLFWNVKKIGKIAGGPLWLLARKAILERRAAEKGSNTSH